MNGVCNLGQLLEDRGFERGIDKGIVIGRTEGIELSLLSFAKYQMQHGKSREAALNESFVMHGIPEEERPALTAKLSVQL